MNKNIDFKQVDVPEIIIVGFQGELGPNGAKHLWDLLYDRMGEISNITNTKVGYGVIDNGLYTAGVQVKLIEDLPRGMCSNIIPERSYNVFLHKGPIFTLMNTWSWITDNCKVSGLSFERYDERFNPIAEDSILELYVSAI